jgi:hypothetical protein
MDTIITNSQDLVIGQPLGGGFFRGIILIPDSGPEAIISAPLAEGLFKNITFGNYGKELGTNAYDSMGNTLKLAEAGNKTAKKMLALRCGGVEDWCWPARDVLEIIYRNCKPGAEPNYCYFRSGENSSGFPRPTYAYTPDSPAQTAIEIFRKGGAEALGEEWHLSSSECSASSAFAQIFLDGNQDYYDKDGRARAFAVRLMKIQ